MLTLDVVRESDVAGFVLKLGGEIDLLTAAAVAAVAEQLLTNRQSAVILDFTAVSFLDSTAIAVLVDLRRVAHDTLASTLALRNMNERLSRLLHITHTHELFDWLPDTHGE